MRKYFEIMKYFLACWLKLPGESIIWSIIHPYLIFDYTCSTGSKNIEIYRKLCKKITHTHIALSSSYDLLRRHFTPLNNGFADKAGNFGVVTLLLAITIVNTAAAHAQTFDYATASINRCNNGRSKKCSRKI